MSCTDSQFAFGWDSRCLLLPIKSYMAYGLVTWGTTSVPQSLPIQSVRVGMLWVPSIKQYQLSGPWRWAFSVFSTCLQEWGSLWDLNGSHPISFSKGLENVALCPGLGKDTWGFFSPFPMWVCFLCHLCFVFLVLLLVFNVFLAICKPSQSYKFNRFYIHYNNLEEVDEFV